MRRQRSASESLLSIALVLEAVLVFFVTLTAFGLKALEPLPAFLGGAGLIVALVLVSGLLRFRWAVWLGWVLQAVLVATGILLPIMFFIGGGFVAIIGDDDALESHTFRGVGEIELPAPGLGSLNYDLYLKRLSEKHPNIPVIIEHLSEDDVPRAKKFLDGRFRELGL